MSPYIDQESRNQIRHGRPPLTAGELNYVITKIFLTGGDNIEGKIYRAAIGFWTCSGHQQNYQLINDIIGAMECAKMEYKRRANNPSDEIIFAVDAAKNNFYDMIVTPYEKTKIQANGDIYE